ncbi:dynamin-like GTPase family protein [Pseudomonas sp.]|uniref:dynamin-like GTPase family protein n=1 Tax=Pseudomonas sp. TaxID=306 RepID=UPI00257FB113|nr:dynamin-like GTPase family protein [Pseudomonas sp.]
MSMERLSQQVDAYVTWKRELMREITRYRSWLISNRLGSEALDKKLERAMHLLRTDHITLAFVGEFSRGKTELINSLFFSDYGQRMLPSQVGRTTMCPTELFFDPRSEHSYIRLLPIETRSADASISQFKRAPEQWLNIALDPSDPDNMVEAFAQVARTKPMQVEQAIQLGFYPEMLESTGKPGQVMVPAWRHALVNIDHPLLRQGLRILDTPGLNALGSEPELTLSMLPNAQAIIFLLSADTGVTASDMEIWKQHILQLDDPDHTSLLAVLNKIDVLWDDLAGEAFVQESIHRIQQTTASQLGLKTADVLPISAKQSLLAKVRHDPELLSRSQISGLEDLLCERIVLQKERLIEDHVVMQVLELLKGSQNMLNQRLQQVTAQKELLSNSHQDNGQTLFELTAKTKEEHNLHHKRLLGLKTNQRLLKRQGDLLREAIRPERLEGHLEVVRKNLTGSWTTIGINQAITNFFASIDEDLQHLADEAEMANTMVAAIYRRHNEENPLHCVDAPQFNINRHLRDLKQLREQADQFRLQLKTLLTEQGVLARRFFATLAQEVIGLHQRLRQDAEQWANDALMPLMQHTLEHKQLLETHMLKLKSLAQETQLNRQRSEQLSRYHGELLVQLSQANGMLKVFRRPAPVQRQKKVVNLLASLRTEGARD